jgi:prephenate dehydratase
MTVRTDVASATQVLGTLGFSGTFAGQAAAAALRQSPAVADEIRYFPTTGAVWDALSTGAVDRILLGARTQRNGFQGDLVRRLAAPTSQLYVHAEVVLAYDCQLLARPGTAMTDITRVFGHGSMAECTTFLDEMLPQASRVRHPGSSFEAAAEVAAGDRSTAVVATRASAERFGLETLAAGIDGGSTACWWVFGSTFTGDEDPTCLVVAGRFDDLGVFGHLVATLAALGWSVRTLGEAATGTALFASYVLLVLVGGGALSEATQVVADLEGCRLVGAYRHDQIGLLP